MNELNFLPSLVVVIVLQLGTLVAFSFFCLTPMRTKILEKFTLLTLLFATYNIIYQVKKLKIYDEDTILIIFLSSLFILLYYNVHFITHVLKKQRDGSQSYKLITVCCALSPIVIVMFAFSETEFFIESIYSNLYMTFPVMLSVLTTTLFFFYKKLSKRNQLLAVLTSGLLLATSLTFYLIREKYNCGVHRVTVNLNFIVLAIFVLLIHRRSFILKIYRGKRKTNIDPGMIDNLKSYGLTDRQIEIAQHIIDGKSYAEIAESCHLAVNTVTKHASNIFKKLDVHDKDSFIKKIN